MLSRDEQTTPTPVVLGGQVESSIDSPDWPIWDQPERDALARVLESGWWAFEGPAEAEFEQRFAELQTARHGLCVANGTVALQLALEALDIGVGDEVIVPGFTWQATAATVVDVNAMPVLVDADPETYCPDPGGIEGAITPRTKAIIVVHLYDSLSDMDRILEIAARHHLHVVEDCAHSHGSQWNGRGVGSVGDIGTFSFQSSKTLTAGEGGFVTTNDEVLFDRLYSLRNCGRRRKGAITPATHDVQSGNYRMTEWQSAILLAQLERFEEQMKTKEQNAAVLDSTLGRIPGIKPMRRDRQVTRRNLYGYVFRYVEEEWQGLSCRAFRKAMSDEMGFEFGAPYRPLNMSSLYRPQTKKRHHLSEQYWDALDPGNYALPVAEHAYRHEAVRVLHQNLLTNPREISQIPKAVQRLRGFLPELLDWERSLPEGEWGAPPE
ncbi:MAG: DegT/DnrJ/EryC1/StrS family aminotransferase [Actinobacteria bacterium]|nr:DegT/DnrJ/EryC1/StrS family aminotransferase [Actinomycetota bacterium]MDQ3531269.1 DegT/DnrJ/EryC1/StrS family aminotransferase [Actinomycetota bacterium]